MVCLRGEGLLNPLKPDTGNALCEDIMWLSRDLIRMFNFPAILSQLCLGLFKFLRILKCLLVRGKVLACRKLGDDTSLSHRHPFIILFSSSLVYNPLLGNLSIGPLSQNVPLLFMLGHRGWAGCTSSAAEERGRIRNLCRSIHPAP